MAAKIFSAIIAFIAGAYLTGWLDKRVWFIIALIGGITGGIIVYSFLVNLFSTKR